MKKLFSFIAFFILSHCMIGLNATKVIVNGDLNKYTYAYIIPTSGVTSKAAGGGLVLGSIYGVYGVVEEGITRTTNPSEMIAGQLMKMGYAILPNVSSELDGNTMIVSYGYLDCHGNSDFQKASSTIIIQFRDAKTQELVASYETTGIGNNDSESISSAITAAMELFQYTLDPTIVVRFGDVYKQNFYVYLTNKTINEVNNVLLHVIYFLDGEVVHEQDVMVRSKIDTNQEFCTVIKRDKQAQSRKMQIKVNVLSYN